MNSSQKPPSPGKPPTPTSSGGKPPAPSSSSPTPASGKPASPGAKPTTAKDGAPNTAGKGEPGKSAAPAARAAPRVRARPKEIIKPTSPHGALVEIEEIDISSTFAEAEGDLAVLKETVEALEKDYGPLEKLKIKNDELKAQVRELRPKFYSNFERQFVLREKIHAGKLTAITAEDLEAFDKHIEKLNKAKETAGPAKP